MKYLSLLASCLMFVALCFSCGSSQTPSDEAKKCFGLIQDKNYEALVEEFAFSKDATEEEIQQTKQMFISLYKEKGEKEFDKVGGINNYEVIEETISEDGQTATVKVKVTYGDGSSKEQKVDLKLVDGNWRIDLGNK